MLAAAAEQHGDRLAVVDGDVRLTWAELQSSRPRDFGAALVASGIEPGDRVAMWAPNGWRWIVAVHGLFQAGAVLVPVNTRFKGAEAAVILGRSGAKALVTTRTFLDTDYVAMLEGAGADLPGAADHDRRRGLRSWDEFLAARHRRRPSRGRPPRRGARPRRRRPTSSSPRAPPACPRAW